MAIEITAIRTETDSMGPSGIVEAVITICDDGKELFVSAYNVDGIEGFSLTSEYPDPECEMPEEIEGFSELEDTAGSKYAKIYKIADKVYKYIGKTFK